MKWLLLVFAMVKPYLFGKDSNIRFDPISDFKDMIKENASKLMLLFASISALATIFAAGIVMFFINIGTQYDANASVRFSSVMLFSLILAIVPAIIMYLGLKSFQDEDRKEKEKIIEMTKANETHPVQDAIVLLIQDYIKEREEKRSETIYKEPTNPNPEQPVNKDSVA